MKRSFQSLSPQEALRVAILIEERNAEIYHRFAELFVDFCDSDSLEMAGVFWDMAMEERRHGNLLQEKNLALFGQTHCSITEEDVLEIIELPSLNDEIFNSRSSASSAQNRAVRVALNAEQQARAYYATLIESTSDPALHALYMELSAFEDEHVLTFERKLSNHTAISLPRTSCS